MMENGIVNITSRYPVKETVDRLQTLVRDKGLTVFARVDHGGEAASVGMALRPTELLIFGDPKGGTPLMQLQQSIGIDLPLKILSWQDADGQVWLSYNDPRWLAERHHLGDDARKTVDQLAAALGALAKSAAS